MALYNRLDARDWAQTHLFGMVNHTMPSFTADLSAINEKAIRHDISLAIEHGFTGTLAVSDVAISIPEYIEFLRIAADEADGRIFLVHHAGFGTLEQNISVLRDAEDAGAELVLLSYPPNFYPESERDVVEYTKAVCEATSLAVMLPGFGSEIHPADIPVQRGRPGTLTCRLLDECSNIVAIRAEGGYPGIQCAVEHFGREIILSVSIENDFVPLTQVMPMQLFAVSGHEYYGPTMPKVFDLLQVGKHAEATKIHRQICPAVKAKQCMTTLLDGGSVINHQAWKFQGWLQGYNGGPLRNPTHRMHESQMNILKKGLLDSGLEPTDDPFREFFVGRNPL